MNKNTSIIKTLIENNCITGAPEFLKHSIHYETIMGSMAYGVSTNISDVDIYGICIPPKEIIFPHLTGHIIGFGPSPKKFDQYQKHHILHENTEYDITVYNIVKFFKLCMENNPNIIDSLFVPESCVLYSTKIGDHVRKHRHDFLHKGVWETFKGYAYSTLHKLKNKVSNNIVNFENKHNICSPLSEIKLELELRALKNKKESVGTTNLSKLNITDLQYYYNLKKYGGSNRIDLIKKYGYDVKFAYHSIRLLDEVEQLLTTGTLDLQKNSDKLKSIRNGCWRIEDVFTYFEKKELKLNTLYNNSKLPDEPDFMKIKSILLSCLEMEYGSLTFFNNNV